MAMTNKEVKELTMIERKMMQTILEPIKVTDSEFSTRMNTKLSRKWSKNVIKIEKQRTKLLGDLWKAETACLEVLQLNPRRRMKGRRRRKR